MSKKDKTPMEPMLDIPAVTQKMSSKDYIRSLVDCASSNSEADLAPLIDLFNPGESREEMGIKFNEVLGYNPITHYDIKDITKMVGDIDFDGMSLMSKLDTKRIAKRAMAIYESRRERSMLECIVAAVAECATMKDVMAVAKVLNVDYEVGGDILNPTPDSVQYDADDDDDIIFPLDDDDDDDEIVSLSDTIAEVDQADTDFVNRNLDYTRKLDAAFGKLDIPDFPVEDDDSDDLDDSY